MSTDETEVRGPVQAQPGIEPQAAEPQAAEPQAAEPSWWHRDHPTFAALSGFFTGLGFVLVVPALFVGLLSLLFDYERAEELFPLVLVTLVVPLALVLSPRSRRFGTYMWIGIVTTAVVVVGVGALVLYVLVNGES